VSIGFIDNQKGLFIIKYELYNSGGIMKKIAFFLAFLGIILGVAFAAELPESGALCGGYTKVSVQDQSVTDTLNYLKENFPALKVAEIKEAYAQVVAGLNVKLICQMEGYQTGELWEIVVFRDLDGEFHFTGAKLYARPKTDK